MTSPSELRFKQVIVIDKSLNMRKGKCVAQGGHASLGAVLDIQKGPTGFGWHGWLEEWLEDGQSKICVYVEGETELMRVYGEAVKAGVPVKLVTDSGRTEFHGVPTRTCLAVGPAPVTLIDRITGDLKLL
jgi:PTH2 family peptidyl-tRNA hydrolase